MTPSLWSNHCNHCPTLRPQWLSAADSPTIDNPPPNVVFCKVDIAPEPPNTTTYSLEARGRMKGRMEEAVGLGGWRMSILREEIQIPCIQELIGYKHINRTIRAGSPKLSEQSYGNNVYIFLQAQFRLVGDIWSLFPKLLKCVASTTLKKYRIACSTLYTPHSALYTPHSTLCTPHSTFYTLHPTL